VTNLLALAKICKIKSVVARSSLEGLTKRVASSAYKDDLKASQIGLGFFSNPTSWAFLKSMWSGSIAKRNNMGDEESPC
jgi:hypothetical protein